MQNVVCIDLSKFLAYYRAGGLKKELSDFVTPSILFTLWILISFPIFTEKIIEAMRTFLLLFLFLAIFSNSIFSQDFEHSSTIGKFSQASSFYLNSAGFIFVTDAGTDQVFKLDTLGSLKKQNGGYGWKEGAFDNPVDVFSNPLNIWIADKNNHRIERFDKDLNFVSSLFTRGTNSNENNLDDIRFGYPLSCAVSNQGDMFILDSENKRVTKFDLFGNFIMHFGNYQWGDYSLSDPIQMAIDPSGNIYVTDGLKILVYDHFGNGIGIAKGEEKFMAIRIIFNNLTLNTKDKIYYSDLTLPGLELKQLNIPHSDESFDIVSSLMFNGKLYVLTPKNIRIYTPAE